ncbi:hypothetical protein F2Q69_00026197 [Brassica cretica]|uniref:X8 domain-containing protein n=1 Tax=Brassica cretica TaxID=69181 RepID=A0A8S9SCV8_BRACR|nr:hypothetical protein F2Q69_00026197 [Brassica cretica]
MKFIVYTIALLLVLLTQGRSDDEHWCIASPGTPDWLLQSNLDYACGFVDCDQQCFLINYTSLFDRTSLAMDLYYKRFGNTDPINCYFKGSGLLLAENPSTHFCTFAGGARGVLVRWIVAVVITFCFAMFRVAVRKATVDKKTNSNRDDHGQTQAFLAANDK